MQCFTIKDRRKRNIWSVCDVNVNYGNMYSYTEVREETSIEIMYKSLKVKVINYAKLTTEMTEFNDTVEVTNDDND